MSETIIYNVPGYDGGPGSGPKPAGGAERRKPSERRGKVRAPNKREFKTRPGRRAKDKVVGIAAGQK